MAEVGSHLNHRSHAVVIPSAAYLARVKDRPYVNSKALSTMIAITRYRLSWSDSLEPERNLEYPHRCGCRSQARRTLPHGSVRSPDFVG